MLRFVICSHKIRSGLFSSSKHEGPSRVETVGFKKNAVHDYTKIGYESQKYLHFVDGKCLIYKYNRSLSESIFRSSFYLLPMLGIAEFIYSNPLADVFPASIPIAGVLGIILTKLFFKRIQWNENLVSEIYLLENGEATEVHFCNQRKRKLFGEPLKKTYYNSIFVDPNFEKEDILVLEKHGSTFPLSLNEVSNSGYSWVKYYSNGENFLLIPKKGTGNMEVLIEIFKGKVIRNKVA